MKVKNMRELEPSTEEKLTKEREKDFTSTTYIDLTRHGSRFGGKMTVQFRNGETTTFEDPKDLTPAGKEYVEEIASTAFPEDVVLVHPRGGDEPRHGETGEDIMKGSKKIGPKREKRDLGPSPILKQGKVKTSRRGLQTDYGTAGMMPQLKTALGIINDKLNELVAKLSDEEQNKFKNDPEYRAKLREQAQVFGLKEVLENPKYENIIKQAAENEAYELMHAIQLSRRGVKSEGKAVAIPIVGSGIFAESLYKYTLVVEDEASGEKKTGFDNVDEIGGFTKQATAFRIKLVRDHSKGDGKKLEDFDQDTTVECEFINDPERAKLFEGKKVHLDWGIVRQLAKTAEERFVKEGLVKKPILAES